MSPTATQSTVKPAAAPKKGKTAEVDRRFKRLDITMKRHQYRPDALIEVLHVAQEAFGYLEEDVLAYVAHGLQIAPQQSVWGGYLLSPVFPQAQWGPHLCGVHGHRLLRQRGR
jgi:bidirectional [NiFe] hydrogenase diaphorase subunit